MTTVRDIIEYLEFLAPLRLGEEYCKKYGGHDNSGLLIGDIDKPLGRVLLALDLTSDVIEEAIEKGAGLIITHHPLIWNGIKNILDTDVLGGNIIKLIQNGIAVYAFHLNLDISDFGPSQILADLLQLENIRETEPVTDSSGMGRIGRLLPSTALGQIAEELKSVLEYGGVRVCGDPDMIISEIAILGGAGGSEAAYIDKLADLGVNLYITSEVKHHVALYAKELGIAVIDGGHYATEFPAITFLTEHLNGHFKTHREPPFFEVAERGKNPFENRAE